MTSVSETFAHPIRQIKKKRAICSSCETDERQGEFALAVETRDDDRAVDPGVNKRRTVTTIAMTSAIAATSCAGRGKKRSFQFADKIRNGSIFVPRPYQANSSPTVRTALTGTKRKNVAS